MGVFVIDGVHISPFISLCAFCKHNKDGMQTKCKAFPRGIPDSFCDGDKHHTSIVAGQVEPFVFEPKDEESKGYVNRFILK